MPNEIPAQSLQLRSLLTPDGVLELSLARVPTPMPKADEVLIRVEATPINPTDMSLLLATADLATLERAGTADEPVARAKVGQPGLRAMAARFGQSLPVGSEGAGTVVAAGDAPEAQALLGKTVAAAGGAMYAQYRCVNAGACLVLPAGTSAVDGASCFVNPLTAIGMVETMRREGHSALVHTAAASNLGQMLQKLCIADGVPLVNIVRRPEQAALLRSIGAKYVCDSSSETFMDDLTHALAETSATIAFDAIGGGKLASQILSCMEAAANRKAGAYNRYGSSTHKQVYIYGVLDRSPMMLTRNFGFAWGVGGWLLTPFLIKIGAEAAQRLRERVASEVKTTFASTYAKQVSLREALDVDAIATYGKQSTGTKYLIRPQQ
jgi:NADPH:quinone reductase-like Zn-dependent oxidoreductase